MGAAAPAYSDTGQYRSAMADVVDVGASYRSSVSPVLPASTVATAYLSTRGWRSWLACLRATVLIAAADLTPVYFNALPCRPIGIGIVYQCAGVALAQTYKTATDLSGGFLVEVRNRPLAALEMGTWPPRRWTKLGPRDATPQ